MPTRSWLFRPAWWRRGSRPSTVPRTTSTPLGTAVVIDERRVLTSAHVVRDGKGVVRDGLWVAFPRCAGPTGGPSGSGRGPGGRAPVGRSGRGGAGRAGSGRGGAGAAALPAPGRCGRAGLVGVRVRPPGPARQPGRRHRRGGARATAGCGWTPSRATTSSRDSPVAGCGARTTARSWRWSGRPTTAATGGPSRCTRPTGISRRRRSARSRRARVASADELAKTAWGWSLDADREADRHWRPRPRPRARGWRGRPSVGTGSAAATRP